MLARRLPINTKTKLDLTKLFYSWNSLVSHLVLCLSEAASNMSRFILLIYRILKAQSNYFSYQLVVYNREQKRHF